MALGTFGGSAPPAVRVAAGGSAPSGDLWDEALLRQTPSPQGAPATSEQLYLATMNAGTNLLANSSFESWTDGIAAADPPGWTTTSTPTRARETGANNLKFGQASFKVTNTASTEATVYQDALVTISTTVNTWARSRTFTFGCWISTNTASRVRVYLNDGIGTTYSDYHTGGGTFELLTVTRVLSATATRLRVAVEVVTGAAIVTYLDGAVCIEGATVLGYSPSGLDVFSKIVVPTGSATVTTNVLQDTGSGAAKTEVTNVVVNGKQSVLIFVNYTWTHDTAGTAMVFQFVRDSTTLGATLEQDAPVANKVLSDCLIFTDVNPAAGIYTYKLQWRTAGGTGTIADRLIGIQYLLST